MSIVKRATHVLIVVLTLLVGATAAAVIVSQTAWFKNWLRGYIVREANQYLNGTLSIERLGGNLFFGIEMENIGLSMDGSQVVAVKDLGLDYNVFDLITKGLSIDSIRLDKPVIYLRREGDTWSLSRLVKKQESESDRSGPGKPIAVDAIGISDGSIVVNSPVGTSGVAVPKRIDHLDAKLSFKYEPVRYSIEVSHVSFRASEPALALNALSGGIAVKDDTIFVEKLALRTSETSLSMDGAVQNYTTKPVFNLQISSDKLSLPEIARLVPALAGIELQPSFNVRSAGSLDRLGIEMNVQSTAGTASGKLVADLQAPGQSVQGDLSVRHLDLSTLLNDPKQKSDINADARADLHGEALSNVNALRGTVTVDSPRLVAAGYVADRVRAKAQVDGRKLSVDGSAMAYGAAATVAGAITLPDFATKERTVAFDVHGKATHLDLRKLPRQLKVPPAATDVTAAYHATGSVGSGSSRTLPKRGTPTSGESGSNQTLAKHGTPKSVGSGSNRTVPEDGTRTSAVSGFSRTVVVDLRFDPSRVADAQIAGGSTAGVTIMGNEVAYRADASVTELDLQRIGETFNVPALADARYKSRINGHLAASGRGTTPQTIDVTANGTLDDTSMLGGTISQLTFDATMAGDTAHVTANGTFSGFDPAVASGKSELKGAVAGSVNVDATVEHVSSGVTLEAVQADATVTLDPSTIGGLDLARASLDATYRDSAADIRTLDITGRDLNVQASGRVALDDSGQSNFTLHADSPNLEAIGKLADQPLTGIGKVDATITGNRHEIKAAGTLVGDGVKYGDNGALALSSQFNAAVPELNVADARVTADTHATFVSIAGQDINEVDAKTTYNHKQLEFDATLKQPQRSLGAAGSLLLHPDHQEVHLQRFALQTQGQIWQLAQGSQATINYGHDAVSVDQVTLVNGNQQIAADGTFGGGGGLKVTLTNVDLANIDVMLLRPPQFTGTLNASATVSGTTAAPEAKGNFKIERGGFRQYGYDSLGGTVNYAGSGLTLDTTLQQNPTTFLTAKGYLPTALFKGVSAADRARAHGAPIAEADRVDLHIESTPIDLGLVQGFTTALTNVTGTVQAKIDVGGSAADPHPTGVVTVDKAGFTVAPTGGVYSNMQGKIDLQPDKVHIDNIFVLDNHQSALSITGDLAIHELEVGGVELFVNANDFKVIDNKLGNVRVNTNLEIAGELRSPRIAGDFGISTGQIEIDQILALATDAAYATEQTEYLGQTDAAAVQSAPAPIDALKMDVRVTVPDDLVIKASDLRAPGAPVSLGALNLTLGGDLRATKDVGKQIVLVGTVNTIRGTYDFQSRRFEILRDGTVRFDGEPLNELNPLLDIRTRRLIQGVEARVDVRGTLKQPEIALSSTPPLEQADILSLIVFNQPINSLGEGQQVSLAQRAQQLATGTVASALSSSIENALGLDTFEISTAPDSGAAASLTVGEQLGQNLYVKVEQGIGGQSETNFILEYELTKWLRMRTNVLQGSSNQQQLFQRAQGSGADLLFFFSY
jgi:autotransporter translocation and assembly factor TamB